MVADISKVPPSALDTEDKIKLVLEHARQLDHQTATIQRSTRSGKF